MIVVYRYRVKSLNGLLNKQARAVNYVWNFCNDTQKHALKWGKKWPSAFDMINLTAGSSVELGLLSASIGFSTWKQPAQALRSHGVACRLLLAARCSPSTARQTAAKSLCAPTRPPSGGFFISEWQRCHRRHVLKMST